MLEGETGLGMLWAYAGIAMIPDKNLLSKLLAVKYIVVILIGVAGLFFETKTLIRVVMGIGAIVAAVELYRLINR